MIVLPAKTKPKTTRKTAVISLALALAAAATTLAATARPAAAQPMMGGGAPGGGMPNLAAISGKPLPDRGMPPGMVTVRVANKMPANAVAGAEVTAIIEDADGEARKRTAKRCRECFTEIEAVPAGNRFHAEVTVDGKKLSSDTFTMPDQGGIRTMLIAGLPEGGGDEAGGGGGEAAGDEGGGDEAGGGGEAAPGQPRLLYGQASLAIG